MRTPLVAGNWKMNGNRSGAAELVSGVLAGLGADPAAEVLFCPPFVHLDQVGGLIDASPVELGAQDVSAEDDGAHTGEVSATMLVDLGCRYVIVGHSERRSLYGESDELVARKFMHAQAHGLIPVLCVGETLQEREDEVTMDVIDRQVAAVVEAAGIAALERAVLAYEPVWAIGTGRTATPEQAQEVHESIRARLSGADAKIAADLRILYGGSVKGSNAAELFAMADIDGGLIGGASLIVEDFLAICEAARS